jgi:hypothetical protein
MPLVCIVPITLLVGFVILIIAALGGVIKSSDSYKIPVARAKADSRVINALGTPIEEGFSSAGITTDVSTTQSPGTSSGNANLTIPISGPKGKGTIYVTGNMLNGVWTFPTMLFKMDGITIDLNSQIDNGKPKPGEAPKQLESNQL